MRKRGEIKRKKIIIYYALAIVFPCLILGFLAFRGIKNDQALVEREQRRNLVEVSQQIIRETDAYLLSIENSFVEIIDSVAPPQKIIFANSVLTGFIAENQAVAGIFFVASDGVPALLNNSMPYIPDNSLSVAEAKGFQSRRNILDMGWQYEFKEKKYGKALQYYQTAMLNVVEDQSGGEILNSIARVQKKLNLDNEAIESYDLMWKNYQQVFIQNRIPLGAVALLEKSFLFFSKTDTVSALENIHLLLGQFQIPAWKIGYSNYTYFLSKIEEIISRSESSTDTEIKKRLEKIHIIKSSLSLSEKHTDNLLAFLENTTLALDKRDSGHPPGNQRHKTRINGSSYLFSLLPGNESGKWVLLMDPDNILKNIIYRFILEKVNESNFYWEVTDENGGILLASENIPVDRLPVYAVFPSNLPAFSLTLFPEDSGLFVSLIYSREGLFFYIFIVIIIILAFGLLFTLQSINNELQFSKMKSNFMSTVSHEFKSPLTSIRQLAEMLVHGRVPSPEKQQKYYTTILQQSERLSHLIENILDFSKMEDGQKAFRFEKDNIVSLVKEVADFFENHLADKGLKISLFVNGSIPEIVFDKEAMEQVMHNLLDNACKYSGDSKTVEVHISTKGNKVEISVKDFGLGIRKEDQDKIFSRFYRGGDELTQTVKGSGIGLTIVRQIIKAHFGKIYVESTPGKGSTFIILLRMN